MRVALLSDPDLVNTNYRAYQPMHVLSTRGYEISRNTTRLPVRFESLMQSEVVLVHRYHHPQLCAAIRELSRAGVGVVWDNDDDVSAVPRENPLYRQYSGASGRRVMAGITTMIRRADFATTPSVMLAEKYKAIGGAEVKVLENFLRDDYLRPVKRSGERVTIGWLAGLEHRLDYDALGLQRTLADLLEAHPQLRVESVGVRLHLESERYSHRAAAEFTELADVIGRFDIGIAPLADIPFNNARSNIKLKEYAGAGVPWLASPVGPYRSLGEREGGLLVAENGWYDQLDALIRNGRARRKLAKAASRWAATQTISRHVSLWEDVLQSAKERARSRRRDSDEDS
jgi:glycosyltransferase involved in cell wall biosynthesis